MQRRHDVDVVSLAAWQQLGERPSAAEAVGIGLILAGLTALAAAGLKRSSDSGAGPRRHLGRPIPE